MSYRSKLCPDCVGEYIVPIMTKSTDDAYSQAAIICGSCGIALDNDAEYLYANIYAPGHEGTRVEASLCGACHSGLAGVVQPNSYRLPDRDPSARESARDAAAWALLAG